MWTSVNGRRRSRGSGEKRTKGLLRKVRGLAKKNALISVYPTHTSLGAIEQFKDEVRAIGFALEGEYSGQVVHEGKIERGRLLNFRKT
ncbi:MAG: hypothetical protein U9R48_11595 [Chloroflexota bacterium]|nr:hypothetical protein [Chloroflexota bacterium]